MALTPLGMDVIKRGAQLAKDLLETRKAILEELNVVYDGAGGLKSTTTDDDLNLVPSLSGLTKAQLDDAMYVLTTTIRTDLQNGTSALAVLAARQPQL